MGNDDSKLSSVCCIGGEGFDPFDTRLPIAGGKTSINIIGLSVFSASANKIIDESIAFSVHFDFHLGVEHMIKRLLL